MRKTYLIFLCLFTSVTCRAETRPPNVLFVSIDDLNDWVGVFDGNPQAQTPNLDRFNAEGGMAMYKAHVPSTVCCPSRSAILTGKFPHTTGVYSNRDNLRLKPATKDLLTLPQYFSVNGYHTLSRGKIFHPHKWNGVPRGDLGEWAFDEFVEDSGWAAPISDERPVNGLPNLPDEKRNYHTDAFDWGPTVGNDETKMKDFKTVEWAVEQLQSREFEKPFFMAVGISKPHLEWYIPQKYFDQYPLDQVILPETKENDLEDILTKWGNPIPAHVTWRRVEAFGRRHDEAVQAYLGNVSFVDDCLGVLLDGLAASRYAEDTIVVVWSDHGWHLGEKQRYGKTLLWQETCRVPLMIRVPGVTPNNKKCMGVVNLIDLYPTLIDLCGLPKNPENEGRSFAKLMADPDLEWNEPIISDYNHGQRVYDGRYSYIVFYNIGTEELYDHETDPYEWNNLVRDPAYKEIKDRLKRHLPTKRAPMGKGKS